MNYITQQIADEDKLIINGIKRKPDGSYDSACMVVVIKINDNSVIARQTTDQFGRFGFTFLFSNTEAGKYKIGYNPDKNTMEEDYDYFDIPEKPSIEFDHIPPDNTAGAKLSHII